MFWEKITRKEAGPGSGHGAAQEVGREAGHDAGTAGNGMGMNVGISAPGRGRKVRFGLALGGGAARGWAHIGVLRALEDAGLMPDIIAGTSIGSVVGGCFAAGKLDALEDWALGMTKRRMVGMMDFHLGSGLIAGHRLKRLLDRDLGTLRIEDLPCPFAAIATELGTGHEIWLTRGPLVEAMRASYALPGVFDPVKLGGRWLMDGALVNPIPVTAARALGADVVICVNLNSDNGGRGTTIQNHAAEPEGIFTPELQVTPAPGWLRPFASAAGRMRGMVGRPQDESPAPGLAGVMIDAFNITQDRISRSRLAGDPPDAMVSPRLGGVGLFDFHRAGECIALGRAAAERAIEDIAAALRVGVPG